MFKNYLTIAWRNLCRYPTFSAIKVFGLSIGLAFCLTILAFVAQEKLYDQHIPGKEKIFSIASGTEFLGLNIYRPIDENTYAVFRDNSSGICDSLVRLREHWVDVATGQSNNRQSMMLVEGKLFDMFSLKLSQGDLHTAWAAPNTVVLSQSLAEKYFSDSKPVGKTLVLKNNPPLQVTGVFTDIKALTHLRYLNERLLISPGTKLTSAVTDNRGQVSPIYIRTRHDISKDELNRQFDQHFIESGLLESKKINLRAIPLVEMNFLMNSSIYPKEPRPLSLPPTIILMSALAGVILWLACANYINMYIASLSLRSREISMRRILGASRWQLCAQLLTETLLVTTTAMIFGLVLLELSLAWSSSLFAAEAPTSFYSNSYFLSGLAIILLITTLAAGLQPAISLARNKLLASATGNPAKKKRRGQILVGLQFFVATLLISAIVGLFNEMTKTMVEPGGFDASGTITLEWGYNYQDRSAYKTFVSEVEKLPGVSSVAEAVFTGSNRRVSTGSGEDESTAKTLFAQSVSENFLSHHRIPLLSKSGEPESPPENLLALARKQGITVDDKNLAILLTPEGLKKLNLQAERAIGKTLLESQGQKHNLHIVGLIPALSSGAMQKHEMIFFEQHSRIPFGISIRYYGKQEPPQLKQQISELWKKIVEPTAPSFGYLNRFNEGKEKGIQQTISVTATITLTALLLAAMGLYAMSRFAVQRFYKTIAVKKVLGANSLAIARQLVLQFVKPVMIASALSTALYYLLSGLARQNIPNLPAADPLVAVGVPAFMLLVAMLTVWTTCLSAAKADPVESLRTE